MHCVGTQQGKGRGLSSMTQEAGLHGIELTSRSLTPSLDRSCFSLRPRCPSRLLLLLVGPSPTRSAAAL